MVLVRLSQRWGYIKMIIIFLFSVLVLKVFITLSFNKSCTNWKNGLFETEII